MIGPFLTGFLPGIFTGSATHDAPLRVTIVIGLITYILCLTVLGAIYPQGLTRFLDEFLIWVLSGLIFSIPGSAAICRMFDWRSMSNADTGEY